MSFVRQKSTVKSDESAMFLPSSEITEVVKYFNRRNDREQIQTAIKGLYALGIRSERDPSSDTDTYETYVSEGFEKQVDAGMVETLSIGFGNRVVNARATLFTESGNRFTLQHENTEDVKAADELLSTMRKLGGHKTTLVRADKLASECGSSAVLTTYASGSLQYQHLNPDDVRFLHADTIEEDGNLRLTDRTSVDEATCVIIRLNEVDINLWNYLAIFGRSEELPYGRWVTYQADNTIEVPEVDAPGSIEYSINGVNANPLSYYAATHPEMEVPEYPIIILYGGITDSGDIMPVTTSLYDADIEFSRAASHTLSKSQEAAAGTIAIKTNEVAAGKPLPKTLTGGIHLVAGQDVEAIKHDAAACQISWEILKGLMVDAAASYSVPDYMIAQVNDNMNREADSGVALQIKTRPLKKMRQFRIEENELSVNKHFLIERSLISLHAGEDADAAAIALLEGCTQTWEAGELRLPENRKETTERIVALLEKGILDTVAAIREYYQLPTDADAIDMYNTLKERQDEFPPLVKPEEPKKTVGILRRNKADAN